MNGAGRQIDETLGVEHGQGGLDLTRLERERGPWPGADGRSGLAGPIPGSSADAENFTGAPDERRRGAGDDVAGEGVFHRLELTFPQGSCRVGEQGKGATPEVVEGVVKALRETAAEWNTKRGSLPSQLSAQVRRVGFTS